MLKVNSMPIKHKALLDNLKANSIPQSPRLQAEFCALDQELDILSSISGVESSQEGQGCFLPLFWTSVKSQMGLMRHLALHGRFNTFAENVRAIRWDAPGDFVSLALRLKAFYLDLAITLDPFHPCQTDLVGLLEEVQRSEDDYCQHGESYGDMEVFTPSRSSSFSSLSSEEQERKVLSQAIECGLWDAVLFVLRR